MLLRRRSTTHRTLSAIANAGDTLSGTLSIQVGSGPAQTVVFGAAAESAGCEHHLYRERCQHSLRAGERNHLGRHGSRRPRCDQQGWVVESVAELRDGRGVDCTSSIVDTSDSLGYTSTVSGMDANLNVDGVDLTSASNTVANLIPGLTMQLLAPSPTESDNSLQPVQVVIGNDNNDIESTVNQFVSDYNALISAVNTQTGLDASGNAEPLFGSPTLSLLQQQLLGGLNTQNPNGSFDAISDATDTTLSGSMTITVGGGAKETIIVGAGTNTANTFYAGSGVNTLAGLADAINAANQGHDPGLYQLGRAARAALWIQSRAVRRLSGSRVLEVGQWHNGKHRHRRGTERWCGC